MKGMIGAALRGIIETMKIIIPRPGKRNAGDDDLDADLDQLRPMTLKSIGPTRYIESTGKKLAVLTTNTPAPTAANPDPGPSNEAGPEPVKEETRREKYRRLKTELERLKR